MADVPRTPQGELIVDPDLLSLRDFKRAREVLDGKDPWEVLNSAAEDRVGLIIWCLMSREDPTFTLDDAMDLPSGAWVTERNDPPRTAPRSSNGRGATSAAASRPSSAPPAREPEPSSATSTG